MSPAVLEHKLETGEEAKHEQAWNLSRWPRGGFPPGEQHRLFVASRGSWCGYFLLSGEALFNPDDERAPYTLLFDARSWTEIGPVPVRRFRGFTYDVPTLPAQPPAKGPPVT